jgi:hypothetical protein
MGGLLGVGGGAGGSSFAAPGQADITNPVTGEQITNAYTGNQTAMQQQQQLLSALQAQNGLQNQSNVYSQLQGVASGTGPNPAQAQLAQATGANVANQAALAAGQRGAGQNVGMIARQAGQTGASAQQQAAAAAAQLQAQQSLSALGQMGNLATTQAGQQIGQTNANVQAQQAEQQALLNAQAQYNAAKVGSQSSVNAANAALANTQMQGQQALIGGVMSGFGATSAAGGATKAGALAKGGEVVRMADGGAAFSDSSKFGSFSPPQAQGMIVSPSTTPIQIPGDSGAQALKTGMSSGASRFSQYLKSTPASPTVAGTGLSPQQTSTPDSSAANVYSKPGGENMQAKGGAIKDFRVGGGVKASSPKQKAKVSGDSYSNDKIPAVLSEGEVVIPRSVMQSKNPVEDAAKFVAGIMAHRKHGSKKR